jgi:hypothetical protein
MSLPPSAAFENPALQRDRLLVKSYMTQTQQGRKPSKAAKDAYARAKDALASSTSIADFLREQGVVDPSKIATVVEAAKKKFNLPESTK